MEERFFFLLYHVKKKEVQKKDKTFGEKRQSAILKKSKNKEQKGTGQYVYTDSTRHFNGRLAVSSAKTYKNLQTLKFKMR